MIVDSANEALRLRAQVDDLRTLFGRTEPVPAFGSPSLVAQTTTVQSYPGSAQRFYGCCPQTVLGPEVEGGAGTFQDGPTTFLALNLGTAIPPAGTLVLATFVESRWVFRYDG